MYNCDSDELVGEIVTRAGPFYNLAMNDRLLVCLSGKIWIFFLSSSPQGFISCASTKTCNNRKSIHSIFHRKIQAEKLKSCNYVYKSTQNFTSLTHTMAAKMVAV